MQIQTDKFSFITVFLNLLLSLIEPVNKQLQADALDVPAVTRMINAVRDEIWKMRSDVMFKQLTDDSGIQLKDDSLAPMKMQFNIETVMWQSANVDLQHGLLNTLLINPDIDMQLTQT